MFYCFAGGSSAPTADAGFRHHRTGDRLAGLLHLRGVGHNARAGRAQREVLLVLRGALPRHHLQPHHQEEDALLHRQPHHSLRRDLLPFCTRLLPPFRLGGEDLALYLHPALAHCLFPLAGGDHSAHFPDCTSPRKVPLIHHDARHVVCSGDDRRPECELQVAGHAQDGAVGAEVFFRTLAYCSLYKKAR